MALARARVMALNPEEKPKEFLIILVATGLRIFGSPNSDEGYFVQAEKFVNEAEKRYGKLNP
jgi:hypothetical protein